jgi:hypothetical protein
MSTTICKDNHCLCLSGSRKSALDTFWESLLRENLAAATMLCDLEEELQIAYRTIEALEARLRHHAMPQEVSESS